jgi:hypothetical protein
MRDNQVFESCRTVCPKYPPRQGVRKDWCHAAIVPAAFSRYFCGPDSEISRSARKTLL